MPHVFRLLEEKENRRISENVTAHIAGVEPDGGEIGFKIPADKTATDSFVAASVSADSAA